MTTLRQKDLQGPLYGILYIASALTLVKIFCSTVQTYQNISCSKDQQTGWFKASSLHKLNKTQWGISKCHLLWSRFVTFIFNNINSESPTGDTGTAVWGRVPSWALHAPFLWPVKAPAWGDARSLICAAHLMPEGHFTRRTRGLNSCEFYLSSVERWSTAAKHQFVSASYRFGSVDSKMHSYRGSEVCVSSTEQPARPAAGDNCPGLQEHTELAGRGASTGCWCKQPTICSCGCSITTNTLL